MAGAELGPEGALERQAGGLDHRHLRTELTCRGGDLATDPSGADHHDPSPRADPSGDDIGISDGTQVQHAIEIRPGHRQPPGHGAGGEQQPSVMDPLAAGEDHLGARYIDSGDRRRSPDLNVMLLVEAGWVHRRHLVEALLTTEVLLRQWRPLVGTHRLLAHEYDPPVENLGRSVSAALAPANAAPTTTKVRSPFMVCLPTLSGGRAVMHSLRATASSPPLVSAYTLAAPVTGRVGLRLPCPGPVCSGAVPPAPSGR